MNRPPAFQFYVKDWRSSPTVRLMNFHQRGLYIEMLAASWDSEEPGSLPLPLEVAAKSIGCDPRSLRDLLAKFPRCFVDIGSKLVNKKLHNQWLELMQVKENRSVAGRHGNMVRWGKVSQVRSQTDRSASASASAIRKPSLPSLLGREEKTFQWQKQLIAVQMGRRRRLPNLDCMIGGLPHEVVHFLNRKGYPARIVEGAA